MKFILAKNVEKPKIEIPIVEKKDIEPKSKAKRKSLPKSQRGPQVRHFCHHCGIQEGTQNQIALSFMCSKGLIICMLKEIQE